MPFRIKDDKAGIDLKKGCQILDGKNALGYVRARYSDPRGDIGRAERQRQFLAAIMKKAATPSTVLVPSRTGVSPMPPPRASSSARTPRCAMPAGCCSAMRAVSNDQGLSLVVPMSTTNASTAAGSAVHWDNKRANALFTMLRNGEPIDGAPAGTDGVPSGG